MTAIRVGVTLPQFRERAEPALETAVAAEQRGLDGVFVFDHLWPLHRPERPALHAYELLGAVAMETRRVTFGTLVSRLSLLPDAVLAHTFSSLQRMVGDRVVAGVGTGDSSNKDENVSYGVPFEPKAARLAALSDCCRRLRDAGVTTWVGGLSHEVRAIAAARADGWNAWGIGVDEFRIAVAELLGLAAGRRLEMSWSGALPGTTAAAVREHLVALVDAGATWAIFPLGGADDGGHELDVLAEARASV